MRSGCACVDSRAGGFVRVEVIPAATADDDAAAAAAAASLMMMMMMMMTGDAVMFDLVCINRICSM